MKIEHNEEQQKFELFSDDNEKIGAIEYKRANEHLIYATQTDVYKGYEGKGYARQLLDALADWARANKIKIYPTCPYVVKRFDEDSDLYRDIDAR